MAKRKKSKSLFTVQNILRFVAAALGIGAFFFMFGNQVKVSATFILTISGEASFSDTFFSNWGSPLGFIGYLLLLIGGAAACILALAKFDKGVRTVVNLLVGVILLTGSVLVFLTAVPINGASLLACPIIAGMLGAFATLCVCCAFALDLK